VAVLGLDTWCVGAGEMRHASAVTTGDILGALASCPSGDVLVVVGGAETAHAARIALSSLRRPDVSLIEVAGPPTRRHAVRLGLELLWPAVYGFADAVMAAIDARCGTRVLLSSVTRLTDPNPGLVDHVASWLRGQYFDVDVDAREVRRTRTPELTLAPGDLGVLAAHGARPDDLRLTSLPALRVEITGPWASAPWRAKQWTEVTVVRGSLADSVQLALTGSKARACPSCARPVTGVHCRFCGIVVPGATRPNAPTPPAVLVPSYSEETHA